MVPSNRVYVVKYNHYRRQRDRQGFCRHCGERLTPDEAEADAEVCDLCVEEQAAEAAADEE